MSHILARRRGYKDVKNSDRRVEISGLKKSDRSQDKKSEKCLPKMKQCQRTSIYWTGKYSNWMLTVITMTFWLTVTPVVLATQVKCCQKLTSNHLADSGPYRNQQPKSQSNVILKYGLFHSKLRGIRAESIISSKSSKIFFWPINPKTRWDFTLGRLLF